MTAVPLRIAHRGMPRRERENTLPSFTAALAAGADGLELDVHATLDGVVVVHHDPVTVHGMSIARTRWEQLRGDDRAATPAIPTLEAVCEVVDGRAALFVEIKGAGIESEVLHALRDYAGSAAIHSFDHAMIARLAARDVRHTLGLLFDESVDDVPALLVSHGATDAWPHHSLVDASLVNGVHRIGGRVLVWTVNDVHAARRLQTLGVDGICSDDVTLLDARRAGTSG